MTTIAVLTTIDSLEQARAIATALVERKLAACAQISTIESIYTWKGSTQDDQEFRVMVKTTEECYRSVEAVIRELHAYELPAIYAFGMTHVFEPYAEWVAEHSIPGEV